MLGVVAGVLTMIVVLTDAYKVAQSARFDQWFQQFEDNLYFAIHDDCWSNYTTYITQKETAVHPEAVASRLIACLLTSPHINEATKANFASAQVLLGFLPTILTFVGCDPSETSVLALRRPLLAMLATIGSPAPKPIRSFIYTHPINMLKDHPENVQLPQVWSKWKPVVLWLQILLVVAAAANTIELALELGYLSVSSFAPTRPWLIILWTTCGILVHICSTIALHLRVNVEKDGRAKNRSFSAHLIQGLRDEFSLCSTHSKTILSRKGPESRWFVFMAWFTANGTALVVVYGTLVFSSLLFISTQDAVFVVSRYMISALVCRAVLMSELNGMRSASKDDTSDRIETELQPLTNTTEEVVDASVGKSRTF